MILTITWTFNWFQLPLKCFFVYPLFKLFKKESKENQKWWLIKKYKAASLAQYIEPKNS